MDKNVFGEPLISCSTHPMTGFYRDGCCNSGEDDIGKHTVCVVMTADFLDYSRKAGNDLYTPRPEFGFAGLKPGDRWCVCALRWFQACQNGMAPQVVLEATHEKTLALVSLNELVKYAWIEKKNKD